MPAPLLCLHSTLVSSHAHATRDAALLRRQQSDVRYSLRLLMWGGVPLCVLLCGGLVLCRRGKIRKPPEPSPSPLSLHAAVCVHVVNEAMRETRSVTERSILPYCMMMVDGANW